MLSRIGNDTDDSNEILLSALAIVGTFEDIERRIVMPPHERSELARIDATVDAKIRVSHTLAVSARTSMATMRHLADLLDVGGEPRASVVATLSRAALVSTGRLIYVLGPFDADERVENARQVSRQQAGSYLAMIESARDFTEFETLQAERVPNQDSDPFAKEVDRLGKGGTRDGAMLKSTAHTMAEAIARDSAHGTDNSQVQKQLQEHIEWMWNVWSGMAHGYAWPDLVPGERSADQHIVPGHWVGDFHQLASFTKLALSHLREASRKGPLEA